MTNLDDLPESRSVPTATHSSASANIDFTSIINKAIDAPTEKFVIFFLMVFCIFIMRALIKFIDVKFIDKRMQTFVKTTTAVQTQTTQGNQEFVDKLEKWRAEFRAELEAEKAQLIQVKFDLRSELVSELNEIKIKMMKINNSLKEQIEDVSKGSPSVTAALTRYSSIEKNVNTLTSQVNVIDLNFKRILGTIKKKNMGG